VSEKVTSSVNPNCSWYTRNGRIDTEVIVMLCVLNNRSV